MERLIRPIQIVSIQQRLRAPALTFSTPDESPGFVARCLRSALSQLNFFAELLAQTARDFLHDRVAHGKEFSCRKFEMSSVVLESRDVSQIRVHMEHIARSYLDVA
jgi:hypothetical protein